MPSKSRFTFTLRPDDIQKLKAYADAKGVRAAKILRDFVQDMPDLSALPRKR